MNRMLRTALTLTTCALAAHGIGCGNLGETDYGCVDTITELAIDEVSPLGFSAQEALAALEGEHRAVGVWELSQLATVVTTRIARAEGGAIQFHDLEPEEWTGSGPQPAIAIICEDYLSVDAEVGFSTSDGGFDEQLADARLVLESGAPALGQIDAALEIDGLNGSYSLEEVDPAEWDSVSMGLHLSVMEGELAAGVSGEVALTAERVEGSGPNGVATASLFPVLAVSEGEPSVAIACGELTCMAPFEICAEVVAGMPDTPSSYSCAPVADACLTDYTCGCVFPDGSGDGDCDQGADGAIRATWYAP